jgi:hypothetical protein
MRLMAPADQDTLALPPELAASVRRVRRRPRAWWPLFAMRVLIASLFLTSLGAAAAAVAWAAWGTDHSARVVRAWSSAGSKRTTYGATYAYELDGRTRQGASDVSAATYLAYRGAPGEPHAVRVRRIGRPPLVYDAAVDTPGGAWRDAAVVLVPACLMCVICIGGLRQHFIEPWRAKRLHRTGTPALGELTGEYVDGMRTRSYYLDYRFTGPDGRPRRGRTPVRRAELDGTVYGTPAWVLYDPARPEHSVLHGVGPYRCEPAARPPA